MFPLISDAIIVIQYFSLLPVPLTLLITTYKTVRGIQDALSSPCNSVFYYYISRSCESGLKTLKHIIQLYSV